MIFSSAIIATQFLPSLTPTLDRAIFFLEFCDVVKNKDDEPPEGPSS
jgi:hypothetical protein